MTGGVGKVLDKTETAACSLQSNLSTQKPGIRKDNVGSIRQGMRAEKSQCINTLPNHRVFLEMQQMGERLLQPNLPQLDTWRTLTHIATVISHSPRHHFIIHLDQAVRITGTRSETKRTRMNKPLVHLYTVSVAMEDAQDRKLTRPLLANFFPR